MSHPVLTCAIACFGCIVSFAAHAEQPRLEVSAFKLDALPLVPPSSKEIVGELTAAHWCIASPIETSREWNQLPSGAERKRWVSFVTVGFNEQADGFVFRFDRPDGAMSFASHVPFRRTWMPSGTLAWVWPTDGMLAAAQVAFEGDLAAKTRQALSLQVVSWETDSDNATPKQATSLDEARAVDPALVLRAVTVMAHAAAFEAGWAPTTAQAEHSATCAVRVQDQTCSFRLTLDGPRGEQTFVKESVPWESYYPHLLRLFRFVDPVCGVSDFAQLGVQPLQLLGVHEDKLACTLNHELTVFDLSNGVKLWTTEPKTKQAGYSPRRAYDAIVDGDKQPLIRFAGSMADINWTTGAARALSPVAVDLPHRFELDNTSEVAAANGDALTLHRAQELLWKYQHSAPIAAGPEMLAGDVTIGDASGELVSLARKDGVVRWRTKLPGPVYGELVGNKNLLLAFCSEVESLIAVDRATGRELWRIALGDVLLESPSVLGEEVFLVTKSNRLLLVDLATGKSRVDVQWPSWLVSAKFVPTKSQSLIACSDLDGTVTVLSASELKPQKTFTLNTELSRGILYIDRIAAKWPVAHDKPAEENLAEEIAEGPQKTSPSLLVSDIHGFLYLLPLATAK